MALLSKFFGRTASEGAAFALGLATGPVLAPEVEELKNATWRLNPTRTLEAGDAAEVVAESVELRDWGAHEASAHGVNGERFDALVGAVLNAPGMGELFQARRRGKITTAEFHHGLRKARLEPLWDEALVALLDQLLSVADLANAVVQGHMEEGAATAEAELQGYSPERFGVLVQNTGLPPGPETLLAWLRRGIITEPEFAQGVREGHTKTKYIPFFEAARQPLLSAATAVRLYLKGWWTKAERDALGAAWGYSSQQMEEWFLSEGRPATARQIHIGYARGAKLAGAANELDAIHTSVKQSDIRPEYADLIAAGRFTYPSAFVLRALVEGGSITRDEGYQALVFQGWEPVFAGKVADAWAASVGGAKVGPWAKKAETQLWTATHKSFVNGEVAQPQADAALQSIGVGQAERTAVFAFWNEEKNITVKPLTPSQIKKAYKANDLSIDDAVARLELQHMTDADARVYLTT